MGSFYHRLSFVFFLLFFGSDTLKRGMAHDTLDLVKPFDVGVILDMDTWVGKISWSCISMAKDDFYEMHRNYSTRLNFHLMNSKQDVVGAASAALDLLDNYQVQAIIGPQTSIQAKFVAELGNKAQVPIISFSATSPFLTTQQTPYFVRTALPDSTQAKAIAALVRSFGWNELIPIFEDTDYGNGMVPYLIDAFQETDARVPHRTMISLSATDDVILKELYILKAMQTRVFVVHTSPTLGSRLFLKAKEADMMREGYAWIMTYGLTDYMGFMNGSTIGAMQGALSIKPYVLNTDRHGDFKERWIKKFREENPTIEVAQPSVFGLWAYDTVWALALAAEEVGMANSSFEGLEMLNNSTNLVRIKHSLNGPKLLDSMLGTNFNGLTGEFRLVNRQLDSTMFEIVNVVGNEKRRIGYWTDEHGISGNMTSRTSIKGVVWPGDSMSVPKGWGYDLKRLRIGVPVKSGFQEFVNREWNPLTNRNGSGFCIEVFDTVMASLPNVIPYEYIPFEDKRGQMKGSYDDLVYQVYLQNFDAVVGDVTITHNRSLYVDFTAPYTELGMGMVVPIKDDRGKSAWIFLKPLTTDLWLASGAFFIFTGFVVWVLEHRINEAFRGPPLHQLGTIFYFSFSTLVFAHSSEKVVNNFTRLVVIIWVFVVLILTSSYTASLASMLTVQQLHPTVTSLNELLRNGDYVGYMGDSSMLGLLNIDKSKLKAYHSPEEYDEALSKGSSKGGVSAIIDEIPYIKVFLSKYCGKYTMVGTVYRTDGFGFVFPKGSLFVADISRTILKITEEIDKRLYRNKTACPDQNNIAASNNLTFDSFWGLFLITGITSTSALISFLISFLYKNQQVLGANDSTSSIWQKLSIIAKLFDQRAHTSRGFKKSEMKDVAEIGTGGPEVWPYPNYDGESPSSFSNHTHEIPGMEDDGTPEGEHAIYIPDVPPFAKMVDARD